MAKEIEVTLSEQIEKEERNYNWSEAAKLYKTVAKSFLDNELMNEAAEAYKKFGYIYFRAAEIAETTEEFIEQYENCVKAYKKAANIYKQIEKRAEELECMADAYYSRGCIGRSLMEAKNCYSKSYEFFNESSEIYSKDDDQESFARTLSKALMALSLKTALSSDYSEIKKSVQKGKKIAKRAWELSKGVGDVQSVAKALKAEHLLVCCEAFTVDFKLDDNWWGYVRDLLSRGDESLKLAERCDDYRILGLIYATIGSTYGFYGVQFVEDEIEQRKTINKGLRLLEKGLFYARKSKDKQVILWSLFWLDWWAWLGGRVEYLQKRISNDLNEFLNIGKTYGDLFNIWIRYAYIWPALYYANFAQRSFFTPAQRIIHAKKGIKYAKKAMKIFPYSFWATLSYQVMTWSYSQLTVLAKKKHEQDKYAKDMLHYAKQAGIVAEKYEGGGSRAAGYSSQFRAYKTLAEIAENKEKKIRMLSAAVDASKRSIGHAIESRTGTIAAYIRVGLLYEELGIIKEEEVPLMKAREIFLNVINECIDRGYPSYAAATHEYIAHVEDRVGNHIASAEHYKKAQKAYKESLRTIEYKPLKNRIIEKMKYVHAWNLIEEAKSYNKRESHIKAKECYENAYEILKRLPNYNYEAFYFFAWISQEEAEHLSKQEKHEEAIEIYERARESFNNAIKTLQKSSKQFKGKFEGERIKKLEKIAKIRMEHCSARVSIEEARILGKQGKHIAAAEKFTYAASQFSDICTLFKIKGEKKELEAAYYLCKAWESMELAEIYEEPFRFKEAGNLFTKASNLFTAGKLKLLASGNSAFCKALEHGCKFDKSLEIKIKAQLYPKVKVMLRTAASSYRKGGFENVADWALATSSYFDAAWYLIKADEEMSLKEKSKLLEIGSGILKSASKLFGKAGYKHKEKEVLQHLDMVEKEEKIIVSALNIIREPSISKSTIGIVSPTCPIETSLSPRISEARRLTEEIFKVKEKSEKAKVFVSYATVDSSFFQVPTITKELINYPKIAQVLYWEEDLNDDIYDYIDTNLGQCDIFLLFCSPNIIKSEAVKMEWQAALKIKKKIIPIFTNDKDIPPLLSTKLGVKFIKDNINLTIAQIYQLILKKLDISQ